MPKKRIIATHEEMVEECVLRLHLLQQDHLIDDFRNGKIHLFQLGVSDEFDENGHHLYIPIEYDSLTSDIKEKIDIIQEEFHGMVYMALKNLSDDGETFISLLWVSDHMDEWEFDHEDLDEHVVFAYVWNVSNSWCSEFGMIPFAIREIDKFIYRTH